MSKLTIEALKQQVPDLTLYQLEADKSFYAFLGGPGLSEDRLHDLFLGCPEEGFSQYFDSTWFPLTFADTPEEALAELEGKVRSVRCEDINKYIAVIMSHSDSINDNFTDPLKATIEESAADVDRAMKFFHD